MSRISQHTSPAGLWEEGSADRVGELRKAFASDSGELQEPALAPIVGEFLARLDDLKEPPSFQLPLPASPTINAPNGIESMRLLADVGIRLSVSQNTLDAPSQARLGRMADVIQHFVGLKEELVRRADPYR